MGKSGFLAVNNFVVQHICLFRLLFDFMLEALYIF